MEPCFGLLLEDASSALGTQVNEFHHMRGITYAPSPADQLAVPQSRDHAAALFVPYEAKWPRFAGRDPGLRARFEPLKQRQKRINE